MERERTICEIRTETAWKNIVGSPIEERYHKFFSVKFAQSWRSLLTAKCEDIFIDLRAPHMSF